MDYEIQRCGRHCASSGRALGPGEPFYSVLLAEGIDLKRLDYAPEAWSGPPEGAVAWWKSQMPGPGRKKHWAPNDVLLQCFEELADQPDKQDMRYVLALLLVRRRVLRQEETEPAAGGLETVVFYCPRNEATYRVSVMLPDQRRAEEIQEELTKLLR